jgi:hypothetical protein
VPAVQDPGFGNENEKKKASYQHQHPLPKPVLRTSADGALSVASFNVDEGRDRLATVTEAAAAAMLRPLRLHGRSVGQTAQTKWMPPTQTLVEALLMTERGQLDAADAAVAVTAVTAAVAAVAAAAVTAAVAKQQQ